MNPPGITLNLEHLNKLITLLEKPNNVAAVRCVTNGFDEDSAGPQLLDVIPLLRIPPKNLTAKYLGGRIYREAFYCSDEQRSTGGILMMFLFSWMSMPEHVRVRLCGAEINYRRHGSEEIFCREAGLGDLGFSLPFLSGLEAVQQKGAVPYMKWIFSLPFFDRTEPRKKIEPMESAPLVEIAKSAPEGKIAQIVTLHDPVRFTDESPSETVLMSEKIVEGETLTIVSKIEEIAGQGLVIVSSSAEEKSKVSELLRSKGRLSRNDSEFLRRSVFVKKQREDLSRLWRSSLIKMRDKPKRKPRNRCSGNSHEPPDISSTDLASIMGALSVTSDHNSWEPDEE